MINEVNDMTEKDLDVAIEKCERIMEFDTRTMQNPVSENGYIFEKVYDLLKFLRQLQFATDTNVGGTNDTISRQAVLDAVDGVTWYHQNKHGEMVSGANDDEHQAWYKAEDIYKAIEALPYAQPEWKWTPCSKEMPPKDGRYLVTEKDAFEEIRVGFRYWNVQRLWGGKIFYDGWSGDQMNEVMAWCELPEPWKEEKAEYGWYQSADFDFGMLS